jgi:hypothetical protein
MAMPMAKKNTPKINKSGKAVPKYPPYKHGWTQSNQLLAAS